MPNACRPCFFRNESEKWRFLRFFRCHRWFVRAGPIRAPRWTGSNRNRKIHAFFKKSRCRAISATSLSARRPMIGKNPRAQVQCRADRLPSTKPKPGNRRFSQKSSRFTEFRGHMGPALIDHPGIAENLTSTFVANLLRRDLVERVRREHKYHQNRHAGFTTATTMTICKNLNLIKIRRTPGKGSILDTQG